MRRILGGFGSFGQEGFVIAENSGEFSELKINSGHLF
jgi:hypothetical protein